jgi:hypothetical protein
MSAKGGSYRYAPLQIESAKDLVADEGEQYGYIAYERHDESQGEHEGR